MVPISSAECNITARIGERVWKRAGCWMHILIHNKMQKLQFRSSRLFIFHTQKSPKKKRKTRFFTFFRHTPTFAKIFFFKYTFNTSEMGNPWKQNDAVFRNCGNLVHSRYSSPFYRRFLNYSCTKDKITETRKQIIYLNIHLCLYSTTTKGTKRRSVQIRQKWWQTMASKERSR